MGNNGSTDVTPIVPCQCQTEQVIASSGKKGMKFIAWPKACKSTPTHATQVKPRTSNHEPSSAEEAVMSLKQGNRRYLEQISKTVGMTRRQSKELRSTLANFGQNPSAVVIGCADSRCPVETLFDAHPGELFVLRNAGNTCVGAEGSIVGSVEYAVGCLGTRLVLVLGHTKCGAIAGATKVAMSKTAAQASPQLKRNNSMLDTMLCGLTPVALKAQKALPANATTDEIAAYAVRLNIYHTLDLLLVHSKALREKVGNGDVQLRGAIFDIHTGEVKFIGPPAGQSDEHPSMVSIDA